MIPLIKGFSCFDPSTTLRTGMLSMNGKSLIAAGLIPRSLLRKNFFSTEVRHSRMHLAGIQAKLGLDPR